MRAGREPARDRGGRAARGAAGDAAACPRGCDVAVGGVLVRGAHRELVHVGLAEDAGAGLGEQARPRSPCRAARSPRGSASRPWSAMPSVQKMSLTATGTPASSPSPAAAPVLGAPEVSVERVAGGRLRVGVEVLVRRRSPDAIRSVAWATVELEQLAHATPAGRGRGRRRRRGPGAGSSACSRGQARPRLVGAQHVLQLDHVGGRLDALEVELGDALDVLEDAGRAPPTSARPPPRSASGARGARRGAPVRGRSRRGFYE